MSTEDEKIGTTLLDVYHIFFIQIWGLGLILTFLSNCHSCQVRFHRAENVDPDRRVFKIFEKFDHENMCIYNEYISLYTTIQEIDDENGDGCPYIYPYNQIDDKNYYAPQNLMNNMVEKVITKNCAYILTTQDHQKVTVNEKYICSMTNRRIESINIL